MTDLWFNRDLGPVSRLGALLHAARPGTVWAVLTGERTFPDDLAQESAELLGLYGAAVHGIGHLLLTEGVDLPEALTQWATAPTVPMQRLGRWEPTLLSVDGAACLALRRGFDSHTAYAATLADTHLTVIAPTGQPPIALSRQTLP